MKLPWLFVLLVICMLLVLYAAAQRIVQVTQHSATPSVARSPAASTTTLTATTIAASVPPTTATPVPDAATSTPPATTPVAPTTTVAVVIPTSTTPPTPTVAPISAEITGYIAYRVKDGDTLADIATRAGSDPALIQQYNRFTGEVHSQQPLIIPQRDAANATIASQPIIVVRGTSANAVALTLDAGASAAPTTQILDALKSRGITITFFLSGDWITKNPELTRRIVAEGHEIGNHSVSHPDFRQLSDAEIITELDGMSDALFRVAGVRPAPYVRPPFGSYDERVLRVLIGHGYLPIFWTLDSLDAFGEVKTADYLVDRLTNTLSAEKRSGAILLAHCGNQSTADALPRILDRFATLGVTITTLSRVL